jgi:hypothetical protein
MIETSEWVCKLSYLKAITQAEYLDIQANGEELEQMAQNGGPEFFALQSDLDELIKQYD